LAWHETAMKRSRIAFAALSAFVLTAAIAKAQSAPVIAAPAAVPSPGEIVAAAPAGDWTAIAPSDLLVMDLAPLGNKPRRVVIQLMPPPFLQGWIGNIRKLAAAHWWDGTAVVRVQDNYVTQWGDPTEKKALPDGMAVVPESDYATSQVCGEMVLTVSGCMVEPPFRNFKKSADAYSQLAGFSGGWPVAKSKRPRPLNEVERKSAVWRSAELSSVWPTHCYGMVGVGRNLSPDTGTGAELYTVIGHAPRHLDRNIALVGRIIEGMEHMSSLPRGTGDLGFYLTPEERTVITSVRLGNEMAALPGYEYLNTESRSFLQYADARANRRDPFFIQPAGGADICNIPVPVRRKK
jgi:cyclophilin family peptidyl-prolyl cis-trans isomerase